MSSIQSPPVMLWLPPRGNLPECWIATRHVVSVYYAGRVTFVEIDTGRTAQFEYAADDQARTAADLFQRAMSHRPTDEERKAYPTPIGGTILSRR